jgi:hypothetical protein
MRYGPNTNQVENLLTRLASLTPETWPAVGAAWRRLAPKGTTWSVSADRTRAQEATILLMRAQLAGNEAKHLAARAGADDDGQDAAGLLAFALAAGLPGDHPVLRIAAAAFDCLGPGWTDLLLAGATTTATATAN